MSQANFPLTPKKMLSQGAHWQRNKNKIKADANFTESLVTWTLSFSEIDVDRLARSRALEYVDLSDNPIPPRTYDELKQLSRPSVSVSERQKEDWEEDLII